MKIIAATGNRDKVTEIKEILRDMETHVVTMKEAGVFVEAEETGETFLENAVIKAKAVAKKAAEVKGWEDAVVMADDSGLVIDALNGEPGICSARYLGHDTPYSKKNADILRRLKDVPEEKRGARFMCAIAAVCPDGAVLTTQAAFEGRIGYEERGENGFGYDPIFYLPEKGRTSAELSSDEKNSISHRGKALRQMRDKLKKIW